MAVRPELLAAFAAEFESTPRSARTALVRSQAELWGLSEGRVRFLVREHLRGPGEARRRGRRKVSEEHARAIARVLLAARDRRGKVRLSVLDAVAICQDEGTLPADFDADPSTVHRRLDELGLNAKCLQAPAAAVQRRSLYANHVHVIDFSVCPQWYFGDDRKVQKRAARAARRDLARLREHRDLRYKPEHLQGRRHLWRYVLIDHLSGATFVRYYYAPGERAEDLADFLYHAWSRKADPAFPMCGVPTMVLADQGAPFRAAAIQTLLKTLGVELELHAPGNAKASGSVERAHRTWEDRFDSKLRLSPAGGLDELNALSLRYGTRYNGERPHRRHGMTRSAAWCRFIGRDQLRLPMMDRASFLRLATRKPETRVPDNLLRISWRNDTYQLEGRDVRIGEAVTIVESPYAGELRAFTSRDVEVACTKLEKDDAGFLLGRHTVDFGSTRMAAHPSTPAQGLEAELERKPLQVSNAFGESMSRLDLGFLAPTDAKPALPEAARTAPPVSEMQALDAALALAGRRLTREEALAVSAMAAEGITVEQLEERLDSLFTPIATEARTA